jgi:fatty acid CoA ligase FadD9
MILNERMLQAFQHFADRPALAERRTIPTNNDQISNSASVVEESYCAVTYADLADRISSVAAQLVTPAVGFANLSPGDRVALLGHAGIDFSTVDFACNLAGLITVPLQTSATYAQQAAIVRETEPRALAATVFEADRARQLAERHPGIQRILLLDFRGGDKDSVLAAKEISGRNGLAVETLDLEADPRRSMSWDHSRKDDQPTMLLYTSGSTGSPKGAIYTDRLVGDMWGGAGWADFFAGGADVSNFHYMPMSHVAGHSSIRSTLARGGLAYFPAKPDLSTFFADISLARPTELSLVPRVCEMLFQEYQRRLHLPDSSARHDKSATDEQRAISILAEMREKTLGGRVTWASCTSAPVTRELKKFVESLLGIEVHELYGTTEIGGVLADGRFICPPVIDYRLDDVPALGYFATDRPDARGELLIKSTSTIPGYFGNTELNREVFTSDGFYRTGDIVARRPNGTVRIIDRKNSIIKLAQGEFVALPSLEATYIARSRLIRQAFLFGESAESSIIGVLVPSDDLLSRHGPDVGRMKRELLTELRRVARFERLNSYEIPSDIIVEPEPFSEANGLLSDRKSTRLNSSHS